MPELPEVEVIKLGLQRKIVGLTLKNIQVLNSKTFQGDQKKVINKKVIEVWRRAKMLGIDMGEETLLFHLKMTGQLIYDDGHRIIGGHPTPDMRDDMPNKSTRVIFEFNDPLREASGSKLFFNDQRKFGWVKVLESQRVRGVKESELQKIIGKLGPEPLEKDFTWQKLKENLLHHKGMPIKVALMDQSVVSGVGNIYASEALFDARIDPRRKVSSLSDAEFADLLKGIRKAFLTSIKAGGSTRAHFVDSEGKKGYFLDFAHVYGKTGQKCYGCSGKVIRITQAGRGTFYCPTCQH